MNCIVCGQDNWHRKYDVLVLCKYCGLVRAKDKYFQTNTRKLYTKQYFNGIDYADYSAEESALKKNFQNRIKILSRYKAKGKILDIGCAYGYFLDVAKREGYVPLGVELDASIARHATRNSNCKVFVGDFMSINIKKESYDVVCMLDTIEHFKKPELYLEKAKKILKRNGILAIETGDIGALLPRVQKRKWRLITPPTHLYYFSKKSLAKLLETRGFKVVEFRYVTFHRTLGQTIYRLSRNSHVSHLLKPLSKLSYPLQTYDLMFVVAKKIV